MPHGTAAQPLSARRTTPELMDEPDVDPGRLERSLRFIRHVNRWLGGRSALLGQLARWYPTDLDHTRTATLLDIGTGSADLPVEAVRHAQALGIDLRVTAVELHPTTARFARAFVDRAGLSTRITILELDALELDHHLPAQGFDYVHAGMFIHHMPDDAAVVRLLEIMRSLTRRGLIWNDLLRTNLARAGIRLLTLASNPIVKHDARVSVDAGFLAHEARALATQAGLHDTAVRAHPIYQRFTLAWHTPSTATPPTTDEARP